MKKESIDEELETLYADMVKSGAKVIKAKGATFYAIAASAVRLIKALLSDTHTLLPLSTLLNGEYGAKDMCMGVPCIVGANGFERVVELPLPEAEKKVFDEKIASLNATYDALEIR